MIKEIAVSKIMNLLVEKLTMIFIQFLHRKAKVIPEMEKQYINKTEMRLLGKKHQEVGGVKI